MPTIAAVILAGGLGERLGGAIKANITIGGQRLLDRVAARLGDASPVLVAHGGHDPSRFDLDAGRVGIADLPGNYAGPLAGFTAAVAWLRERPAPPDLLVTTAVDIPYLPPDYLPRLLAAIGDAPVAVASYAGQDHPTQALWRLAAVTGLPDEVAADTSPHSLKRLIERIGATRVDWSGAAEADPFASINTPEDLAEARARLG